MMLLTLLCSRSCGLFPRPIPILGPYAEQQTMCEQPLQPACAEQGATWLGVVHDLGSRLSAGSR
jgi:hypothetical protein